MNVWAQLIALTLLPWLELRGSIPAGIVLGLDPFLVFVVCTATNMLLAIPLFLFLDKIFPAIEHLSICQRVLAHVRKKTERYVVKWGWLGLMILVSIPLPGTGVYTGSIAAYIFNVPRASALPSVAAGAGIAGIIVTLLSAALL